MAEDGARSCQQRGLFAREVHRHRVSHDVNTAVKTM